MIRQEAFDAARNMKPFLEVQFTPEQFNSWRKSIDSDKNWTEEERKYLKSLVDVEESLKTWKNNISPEDMGIALEIEKEIRTKMKLFW